MSSTKHTSSPSTKDVDSASVFSTSTFSSTISLLKKGSKAKLPGSGRGLDLDKEQKKLEKEKREKKNRAWDLANGDNKSARLRTAEAYMITAMLK